MGCDIHLHTEIKVNGQWYTYGTPNVPRSYSLFALMAGVRREPGDYIISEPKGMPADASVVAAFACKRDGSDGHSHSYLTAAEIVVLEEKWDAIIKENGWDGWQFDLEAKYFGYLFGNSWAGFTKYPEDRPEGVEDVRFVFWFDN